MIRIALTLCFIFVCDVPGQAATIAAASCSDRDVNTAISSASNRDTVTVPSGDCTWDDKVTFTKGITLQGAGCATDANGRAIQPCSTIIRDNTANGGVPMLWWFCVTGQAQRLTGFEFRNGGRTSYSGASAVLIDCPNQTGTTVRVDHNVFDHIAVGGGSPKHLGFDTAVGSTDHNTFLHGGILLYGNSWNGVGNYGDQSWNSAVVWGSSNFMFVENNTFTADAGGLTCTDAYGGARFVLRFNTFTRCSTGHHGTDSTGRFRATRAVEIYKNDYDVQSVGGRSMMHENRDGSVLLWGNTGTNLVTPPYAGQLKSYRALTHFAPWGQQDGSNAWDVNDPANPYDPGAACPSSICTATAAGGLTVTVAGAGWSVNQWAGYIIVKGGCTGSNGVGCAAPIASNTSTVITFQGTGGLGTNLSFSIGSTFQLKKILRGMDQPGRNGGSLVSGTTPSRPARWNDQTDFPSMQFLNMNNGGNLLWLSSTGTHTANETYVDYDSSKTFDGTIASNRSAIGVGANRTTRPTTCTTGVYWWNTGLGSWNSLGADGVLDKCTAPNTWTNDWYIPASYPHSLQGR